MRSAVESSLPQTLLPPGDKYDVFQKQDIKAPPLLASRSGEPVSIVSTGFCGAPTLPYFLSYGTDHFSCSTGIEDLRYLFRTLSSWCGFVVERDEDEWGYLLHSFPEEEH